ncbi:MAG: 50S ribosomal protein L13 [Candidatus Harrisonbacteria bacterium]|nr:50S ribosomal protein L13 [Candidatus Harrisonbacteria bacterium]
MEKKTHNLDASAKRLGRLASEIAVLLQGKHRPDYTHERPGTEKVVVMNASKMDFSGKKYDQKIYYKHTGYMGHLKEKTLKQAMEKSPEWVLRRAVFNMLPKNSLRRKMMANLSVTN